MPEAAAIYARISSDPDGDMLGVSRRVADCRQLAERRAWPIARSIAWLWVVVEIINGIVHPLWALRVGGYAPGVATAPLLLILALYLARQLIRK